MNGSMPSTVRGARDRRRECSPLTGSPTAGPIQNSNRLHSLEQAAPWKHLESQLLFPGGSMSRHHLLGEDMALVTDTGEGGAPQGTRDTWREPHQERPALGTGTEQCSPRDWPAEADRGQRGRLAFRSTGSGWSEADANALSLVTWGVVRGPHKVQDTGRVPAALAVVLVRAAALNKHKQRSDPHGDAAVQGA